MLKTKEEIEKEFPFNTLKGETKNQILEAIDLIRQDDLEEVKKIIKEKGLHLGYKNDILDKLDNLNK